MHSQGNSNCRKHDDLIKKLLASVLEGGSYNCYVRLLPMELAVTMLWALLSLFGAVALACVVGVVNPHEKVNGL